MLRLPAKMKLLLILAEQQKLNFYHYALFYMKTRFSVIYFVGYCLWKLFFNYNSYQTLARLVALSRLYEKIFKTRKAKREAEYKAYKNMFEIIKRKSKKSYYSHTQKKYLNIKITLKKHRIL